VLFLDKATNYLDTVPPLLLLIMAFATVREPRRDYIVYFLGGQCLFNGYANLLNELEKDNLFAYSLNFSWAYFILSLYFAKIYSSRFLGLILLSAVVLYQLHSLTTLQPFNTTATFNSLSFGTISLLITLYCLIYYTRQLSKQPTENILRVRDFWYITGIFTYYTSNFFIFLTYSTLIGQNLANIGIIWKIHNVVFLLMCLYFFVGLQCKTSPDRSS
jgi:hypothetical protein